MPVANFSTDHGIAGADFATASTGGRAATPYPRSRKRKPRS